MKNFIRLSVLAGLGLLQSCTSLCTPPVNSNSITSSNSVLSSNSVTKSSSGSDKYEIQWIGNQGSKIYGSYVIGNITKLNAPPRIENVEAVLPHRVNFSAPQESTVSADAVMLGGGKVEVKIYRNGSECGRVIAVGSGAGAGKICQ
ncbi:hypothetical protein [uncultured Nostoc sp.]|uniref:hypothetical protein n=1 Tax=uncultured Nostoc sp. TaxID=340711 RepID=UPI0035CC24A5